MGSRSCCCCSLDRYLESRAYMHDDAVVQQVSLAVAQFMCQSLSGKKVVPPVPFACCHECDEYLLRLDHDHDDLQLMA